MPPSSIFAFCASLLVCLSCGPLESAPGSPAPLNSCLATACSAYSPSGAQGGSVAECQSGTCVVAAPASVTDPLILVVVVAEDSSYAPGRTFAVAFANLFAANATVGCSALSCCPPGCAVLPAIGVISQSYVITPQVGMMVNAPVGNVGAPTVLPVQATYRPLWGSAHQYATSLGLPLEPVQADVFYNAYSGSLGPGGGPSVVFETYLQAGLQYELTARPDSPLSATCPPEVATLSPSAGRAAFSATPVSEFDLTTEEPELGPVIPQFNISRAAGLDGWTAYLRDATTLNIVSNVAPLSGTQAPNVVLATNRFAANQHQTDALTNAELVLAPPAGAVVPSGVFAPAGVPPAQELPSAETYPALPAPVSVTGTVTTASGAPILADLTFQATAIIAAGTENTENFEYVGRATTSLDPHTGAATYTVGLPPGQYSEVVRPYDFSAAMTLGSLGVPAQAGPLAVPEITLGALQGVRGQVLVTDGRFLSDATVEVIPTQCASPATPPLPVSTSSSVFCLPRAAQTTTALDGSFLLNVDPGEYLLRVRPADGSRLPWVTQPLSVGLAALTVPRVYVPAPVSVGLQLVDPNGNAIVRSLVSVYSLPAQGAAVELGNAVTDTNGHYDMYISPSP